jgi:pyruvate,water dikinase
MKNFIRWFDEISIKDVPLVGGKTASLGEMYQSLAPAGIKIPNGFALTAAAFTEYLSRNHLSERIYPLLNTVDFSNTNSLAQVGQQIRTLIRHAEMPASILSDLQSAYLQLCEKAGVVNLDVAVRSSATAEDLPDASFAGQQETFLNVQGPEDLATACRNCFASLFTDRAISYRASNGFEHHKVQISVCVQQMVRSDLAASGVLFTLDTESGARNIILINSAYGLGENIVGGRVDPDEFLVLKPLLGKAALPILRRKVGVKQQRLVYSGHGTRTTKNVDVSEADRKKLSISDAEVLTLADWGQKIESHYSKLNQHDTPMDIEWAKDGRSGELFILQARPETVHASSKAPQASAYVLEEHSEILLRGRAVGAKIGAGKARIIHDVSELHQFQKDEVLIADMTDPDWEPIMKMASAIVTNRGGRTCHAAIVSREHGVPCVVGTGTATEKLKDHQTITVSCAEGDEGMIFEGLLHFREEKTDWKSIQKTTTSIMVNIGNPGQALKASILPVDGVGLVRMEFIISDMIKVHPMALVHLDRVTDPKTRQEIQNLLGDAKENPSGYFVEKLSEGLATIAGAFFPRPVTVRFSDFKTNEYANLLGGSDFEPDEENPMIGFRGACRYYDPRYREGFALECQAIHHLREKVGLTNIKVMVPFCRSPEEGRKVLQEMANHGLVRGENGLEVYVMSELPANVILAEDFARIFDGFSIGSNDLTQMVLGVDRDSAVINGLFDERNPAVLKMIEMAITAARSTGRPIGICGQAPSDFPEISRFLVDQGISSISVTSDALLRTLQIVSNAE